MTKDKWYVFLPVKKLSNDDDGNDDDAVVVVDEDVFCW